MTGVHRRSIKKGFILFHPKRGHKPALGYTTVEGLLAALHLLVTRFLFWHVCSRPLVCGGVLLTPGTNIEDCGAEGATPTNFKLSLVISDQNPR